MRLKALAAIVSFLLLTLNEGVRAQQSERSVDTSPAWNDNSLITVQKKGGDPTRAGDVRIQFYGHDAFKITSPAEWEPDDLLALSQSRNTFSKK